MGRAGLYLLIAVLPHRLPCRLELLEPWRTPIARQGEASWLRPQRMRVACVSAHSRAEPRQRPPSPWLRSGARRWRGCLAAAYGGCKEASKVGAAWVRGVDASPAAVGERLIGLTVPEVLRAESAKESSQEHTGRRTFCYNHARE